LLVDANLLLYSALSDSPFYERSRQWLGERLGSGERLGIASATVGAFLRISTNPRAGSTPLSPARAWRFVEAWFTPPQVWIPAVSIRTIAILGSLVVDHDPRSNLVPDAQLAALAIEHGLTVASHDAGFSRFKNVTWLDPLAA